MFKILLIGIICFFSAYGAVQFFDEFFGGCSKVRDRIVSVVPLHNNESEVECIIRNAFFNHSRIIAVDYDSYDDTVEILHTLQEEFPGLSVFTEDEFEDFLKEYCYEERNGF